MRRISRPSPGRRIAGGLAVAGVAALACLMLVAGCRERPIRDDAMLAGLTPADFPQLATDVFRGMDPGVELSEEGVRGRNTWNLWTAGSQVFLDWLAREGYGISDVLKLIDSRGRGSRFARLGLINEPGFVAAESPDRHGLWIDVPAAGAERGRIDADIAAEGIDERVYGRSTGILGLRLYPNPAFDTAAAERWDAERFYDPDDSYSRDPTLVRPYRVGMACGICHIAPHPLRPPADPENPEWENLASAIGNQYFREGRVFASNLRPPPPGEPSSFLWELLEAQLPGTSDTSRMATDHINNPNAINAIFNLGARLAVARENPDALETVGPGALLLPGGDANPRYVPHVLKDGADSIGVPGATIRVYVNIGLFSQYWLTLQQPLVGIKYQRPFEIATAQANSVYWQATEERLAAVAEFLSSVGPMHLEDAEWTDADGQRRSGRELVSADTALLDRGARLFGRNCAGCHSSRRPPAGLAPRSPEAKEWFENDAAGADFRAGNFLSEDRRHEVTEVGTNACRALATNAKRGRIWDNFSSETYKSLPAVEKVTVYNPFTLTDGALELDLAERGVRHSVGYYRTPSLISVWSSAPLLHNNALGAYTGDPSVEGRLRAFEDAAEKLLWPERRDGTDSIWRTRYDSALKLPLAYLPEVVARLARREGLATTDDGVDYVALGPIPAGTPINLLASLDLSLGGLRDAGKAARLVELGLAVRDVLTELAAADHDDAQRWELMKSRLLPLLVENNNCPDLVEDRGHEFGTDLADEDKRALIEFLKTL